MRGCERRRWFAAVALLGLSLGMWSAQAADQVSLSATLIHASNTPGPSDGRLKGIEGNLRRMFKFQSYKYYGGGSATAAIPSQTSIGLGHGNQLAIVLAPAGGNRVETRLDWRGPAGQIQNTTTVLTRGGPPIILGGAQQDGGTMIIAVSAR